MIYPDIPIKALSILNPWGLLIATGMKNIENREWRTSFRGPVAIHAGKKLDTGALHEVMHGFHPVTGERSLEGWPPEPMRNDLLTGRFNGGIIGVAEIVDCVEHSDSEWFVGSYGFVLANARPVPFIPVTGALGFFDWRKMLEKDQAKLRSPA